MPYVIERIIGGVRMYAIPSLGKHVYTQPAHKATQFATREDAARCCLPEERPVILMRILQEFTDRVRTTDNGLGPKDSEGVWRL